MAYKNLVLQSCADKVEWFCRMRDFLCKRNGTYDYSTDGIGWTLYDSSYATDEDNPATGDWFVIKSSGESGTEQLYMQIVWVANYVAVKGYLYWDSATHVGIHGYNTANNIKVLDTGSSYELSVYGDLDFCIILETLADTYDHLTFWGKLTNTIYDSTMAVCASGVSSGTDVIINLDAVPAGWSVDERIFIFDNARIDMITIKTIAATSITADLAYSYGANCRVAACVPYVVNRTYNLLNMYAIVGHSTTNALAMNDISNLYTTNTSPELLNNDYIPTSIACVAAGTFAGYIPNMWRVGGTGLTEKDALTGTDFNIRFFKYYASNYIVIKEV